MCMPWCRARRRGLEAADRRISPTYPRDALLLSVAVPTIAFAGVTAVPEESWDIVERARVGYGDDWWYAGLLAFIRQEQCRWDEAMSAGLRDPSTEEPTAGHSVHARAHVHYETGDHVAGRDWLDGWIAGPGRTADNLAHYSWHAALHELSMGDFARGARPLRRTAARRRPWSAVGPWWTPARCCGAGRSLRARRDVPPVDSVLEHDRRPTCSMHHRRRSWRCTRR